MKVLIVAEYYPRAADPVRGVWAHRQALAARDAGAEVRVLVLHRPLPPLAAMRPLDLKAFANALHQPRHMIRDGISIEFVRYVSPPRPLSYGAWGRWAAPALQRAIRRVEREFQFDLIHAHYAVPAGDAVRRATPEAPLVVSVHGHDVHGPLDGHPAVGGTLAHARLVLANSAGTARRCSERGARATAVVHLGTDVPESPRPAPSTPTLATVAHLVPRKCHADVIEAVAVLRDSHPELRYVIVGDGPERQRLGDLASARGIADRVEFRGQLAHEQAVVAAQSASLFVLPSVDEAFGVAYLEAMAGGVPAIGSQGEDGPAEITAAAAGGRGMTLVPPRDPGALAQAITRMLGDGAAGRDARAVVERCFTWEKCGRATVEAYQLALSGRD